MVAVCDYSVRTDTCDPSPLHVCIFVIGFVNKETSSWSALWFIVFAFIGRVIGYGLDRIVDKNNQKKHG